jgi:NtrC-family two-component system response regulator AlgB
LNVITVEMPPLRVLPEDLVRFSEHYVHHFAARFGRNVSGFTDDALTALKRHSWPGNLRELRNAIERAVILTRGDRIVSADFPAEIHLENLAASNPEAMVGAPMSLERLEELHIRNILGRIPNLGEAASALGIDQATLYRKRKKFGLE